MEGFKIINGKGFYIEFPNHYIVSVQFGFGNYCENAGGPCPEDLSDDSENGRNGSRDAEVAVINGLTGDLLGLPHGDSVYGRASTIDVAKLIQHVVQLPAIKLIQGITSLQGVEIKQLQEGQS